MIRKLINFFKDKKGFLESLGGIPGGIPSAVKQLTNIKLNSYKASIDASSIVLAHSILDSAAFDYLRVIQLVAPLEDWATFI